MEKQHAFEGGIYLHIPFCKQACHYCNFHFVTSLTRKEALVKALTREIQIKAFQLDRPRLRTIYLGGGTPSVLSMEDLTILFDTLEKYFEIDPLAEVTMESNPDDLSRQYLSDLKQYTSVNRLSIGIQSFFEEDLKWMHRAHNADQAHACIEDSLNAGFQNLSADLIFGYDLLTNEKLKYNIDQLVSYPLSHISAYSLTVEPKTLLQKHIKIGKDKVPDNEQAADQFILIDQELRDNGYDHYEISNYALPGRRSQHNTSYWNQIPYIGIGPSAHSFDGKVRSWNIANNAQYIQAIENGTVPAEYEVLTPEIAYNELILTRLRIDAGVSLAAIRNISDHFVQHFLNAIEPFVDKSMVDVQDNTYRLTLAGMLLADDITSDLFY